MNTKALNDLADRVEKAEAGSRELDVAIALALPKWTYGGKRGVFFNAGPYYEGAPDRIGFRASDGSESIPGNAPDMMVPRFTPSLDAAMSLVPEGQHFGCGSEDATGTAWAWVGQFDGPDVIANASSPALALVAASLRAIAEGEGK